MPPKEKVGYRYPGVPIREEKVEWIQYPKLPSEIAISESLIFDAALLA